MNVEEVVLDFAEARDVPLMEIDSDIDDEEDTRFTGRSQNYVDETMELELLTKLNLFR